MKTKIILVLIAAILSSCVDFEKVALEEKASWIGKSDVDLMKAKGMPTQIVAQSNGGRVLVYDMSRSVPLPGNAQTTTTQGAYGTSNSTTTFSPGGVARIHRVYEYWLDRKNRVEDVIIEHN